MSSFEIDPIYSDGALDNAPALEVSTDSEWLIRNRITELLDGVSFVPHIEDEDDVVTMLFLQEAEFKLPNGDRISLHYCYDETSENGGSYTKSDLDQYDVCYYHPLSYDEKGRLSIRKISFDMSFDANFSEDTIGIHREEYVEVLPAGVWSSFGEALRMVAQSPIEIVHDAQEISSVVDEVMQMNELKEDLNKVTPEKLGFLYKLLCMVDQSHRVYDDNKSWKKRAIR